MILKLMIFCSMFVVILSTTTCSIKPSEFGQHVYPPELRSAGSPDLSTAMITLANKIDSLNLALDANPKMLTFQTKEVIERLEEMEEVAASLRNQHRITQHPMFDEHLQLFLKDVSEAKNRAQLNPPDYFMAGKIAGSCQYCHGPSPFAIKFEVPRRVIGMPR